MYSPSLGRFISQDPKGYIDGMNLYAYVKNNPLRYLDAFGTTAYQRIDGGYVSYSISGRTDDFTVSYDNGSGFGNSGNIDYSHDNVGQYTTYNRDANMTVAKWDNGSYTEYNNGISIFKENGVKPIVSNPSLEISNRDLSINKFATQSTRVLPTEYEQKKAASAEFSNLSGYLSGASILLTPLSTPLGIGASVAGAISYAYDPDKNFFKDSSQATNNGIEMMQNNRSK